MGPFVGSAGAWLEPRVFPSSAVSDERGVETPGENPNDLALDLALKANADAHSVQHGGGKKPNASPMGKASWKRSRMRKNPSGAWRVAFGPERGNKRLADKMISVVRIQRKLCEAQVNVQLYGLRSRHLRRPGRFPPQLHQNLLE